MTALFQYRTCWKCGEKNPQTSLYCLNCGASAKEKPIKKADVGTEINTPGPQCLFNPLDGSLFEKLNHKRSAQATMERLKATIQCRRLLQKGGGFQFHTVSKLTFMPRDYQLQVAKQVLSTMGGNAILADEVGLGKTVEAGLILNELRERGMVQRILVIVPAALMEQWQQELADKFFISSEIIKEQPLVWPEVAIISHQRARTAPYDSLLSSQSWDLVIVDEAQILRSSNTLLYRFIYNLPRRYTLLLTATPLQNNLYELYSLIQLVQPGHFRSKRFFRRRFIEDSLAVKNADLLQESCRQVMVRNRRVSTMVPIPPRQVECVEIELSEAENYFYQFIVELARLLYQTEVQSDRWGADRLEQSRWLLMIMVLLKESTSSPTAVLSTMTSSIVSKISHESQRQLALRIIDQGRKLGLSSKMKALLELLKSRCHGEKVIIYTEYLATMNKLEQVLSMAGYDVVSFNGTHSARARRENLERFKNNAQILLSSEVGGQGLNLQFCHIIINYDLPWNPMRVEQRIGRVHRLGQQYPVEIYNIVAAGTFESYLLSLLWAKIGLFTKVIGEIDSILSYLKDSTTVEQKIGQAILESGEDEEVQKRFQALAKEVEEAQELFDNDQKMTSTILDMRGEVLDE